MQHNPLSLLGIVNLVHTSEGTPTYFIDIKVMKFTKDFFKKYSWFYLSSS
jgi:hypothetical protein